MTMVFAKLELKFFRKYHYSLNLYEIQTIPRFSISELMYKFFLYSFLLLKFMFSKKPTKIDEIFTADLTLTT